MIEQELVKEFDELEIDSRFISNNSSEFSHKYARKFIVIKDQQVIAMGDNFENVLNDIKKKGIDTSRVLIEYIPDKGEIILY